MFTKQIYVKPAVREIALSTGAYRICSMSNEDYTGQKGSYDDDSD